MSEPPSVDSAPRDGADGPTAPAPRVEVEHIPVVVTFETMLTRFRNLQRSEFDQARLKHGSDDAGMLLELSA